MNALKSFKHILHVFILWKTHFKRLCNGRTDRPTDGQTEKWLIESRSTRLKKKERIIVFFSFHSRTASNFLRISPPIFIWLRHISSYPNRTGFNSFLPILAGFTSSLPILIGFTSSLSLNSNWIQLIIFHKSSLFPLQSYFLKTIHCFSFF